MMYKCSTVTQSHTPTSQKRKFIWIDKSIKQLSMQCHVRTIRSRLVLRATVIYSPTAYGCFSIRQRDRDRLWTEDDGLLETAVGAVRAQ